MSALECTRCKGTKRHCGGVCYCCQGTGLEPNFGGWKQQWFAEINAAAEAAYRAPMSDTERACRQALIDSPAYVALRASVAAEQRMLATPPAPLDEE